MSELLVGKLQVLLPYPFLTNDYQVENDRKGKRTVKDKTKFLNPLLFI